MLLKHAQRREEELESAHKDGFQAPAPYHITAFCSVMLDVLPDKTKYSGKDCKRASDDTLGENT